MSSTEYSYYSDNQTKTQAVVQPNTIQPQEDGEGGESEYESFEEEFEEEQLQMMSMNTAK